MKKILNLMLLATLSVMLGLTATSCKDDDNENNNGNGGQSQEAQSDQAAEFWAVVGQLVGIDQATDDYADKSFEPTIGEAKSDNHTVRLVATSDMVSAAERFANLVGLDDGVVNENTANYTWTNEAVGTLIYTKTQDGSSLATVDVDIKQVPGLRQIVYLTPAQAGTNAANNTNCYYHFGDVISRVRPEDQVTEYWVCVRPSFEPAGKGESHWVTVSPLPEKNIKTYTGASNEMVYTLPTNLSTNEEHMQNLAEMLFAMQDPETWENNVSNYYSDGLFGPNGLRMFHDLKPDYVKYLSKEFWQRVAESWSNMKISNKEDLWQLVFGQNRTDFYNSFNNVGLHLLHKGYSWHWLSSNNLTLFEYVYKNTSASVKSNQHNVSHRDITHQVVNKQEYKKNINVNIKQQYRQDGPFLDNDKLQSQDMTEKFFGDDDNARHYIFRHATGAELSKIGGGKYNTKTPISGFEPVYVYTTKYNLDLNKSTQTREDILNEVKDGYDIVLEAPDNETGVYQLGDVLECEEDGSRWFCISPKPQNGFYSMVTDQDATFVSLDIKESSSKKASGLPSAAELNEYAFSLLRFYELLVGMNGAEALEECATGKLGRAGEHIKTYAGVDIRDLVLFADSAWQVTVDTENGKKDTLSRSKVYLTNIAYDDGSADHQAVARIIYDATQAGTARSMTMGTTDNISWKFQDFFYRIYKHYEKPNSLKSDPPHGWTAVGGTKWQWLWAIDPTLITLQDLTDANLVNTYANADKWTRLPVSISPKRTVVGDHRKPRTMPEASARPSDFFYKNGEYATSKRSMWNEPVVFMRFMKIQDPGFRKLNLVSRDGRQFKVIHLSANDGMYQASFAWTPNSVELRNSLVYVDNEHVELAPVPGWIE